MTASLFNGPAEALPSTLGSNGKSVHTAPEGNPATEYPNRPKRKPKAPRDVAQVLESVTRRQRRFELTRLAGSCLYEKGLNWKDQHATCWCHRGSNRAEGERLPVLRRGDSTGARLEGVITCGLGWTCPVCAAQISEARRQELQLAVERHCAGGGGVYLLSCTMPHTSDQALMALVDQLQDARKRLQNCRKWKETMEAAGRVGSITGLEVTVGWNGWHPHFHMLVLTDRGGLGEGAPNEDGDLSSRQIDVLKLEWVRILLKVGAITKAQGSDVYKHGLNVRGGDKAAEYIAKYGEDHWGLTREMAATYAKIGVRGTQAGYEHFSPFQLLEIADAQDEYSLQARAMFREFAEAFKGRRMLTWSPGLKKHFNIAELDDQDIAAELGSPAKAEEVNVASISQAQFSSLTRANLLGAFLTYVTTECADIFIAQDLIDSWIERRAGEAGFRGSGEVLHAVPLHMKAPARYRWHPVDETE